MSRASRTLAGHLLLVLILALAATAGVVARMRSQARTRQLQQDRQAAAVTAALQQARMRELQLRAHTLATDPAFVDYVSQSLIPNPQLGGGVDSASINNLLDERRKGYDTAVVLDAGGSMVTRSGMPLRGSDDFRHDRLVRRVLRTHRPASGLWSGQDVLARVAVQPLLLGKVLKGVLIAATRVQPSLLADMATIMHAHAAIVVSRGHAADVPLSTGMDPTAVAALADGHHADVLDPNRGARMVRLPVADGHARAWVQPIASSDGRAALVIMGAHARLAPLSVASDATPLLAGIALLAVLGMALAVSVHVRRNRPMEHMTLILQRVADGENGVTLRTGGDAGLRGLRDVVNGVLGRLP